jgi:peptidoglycan hydrolase CwlO-like protein
MTPINIAIPESLTTQKAELESQLAGIVSEEEKLAVKRKDIQVALQSITTGIAILSGQPLQASKAVATPTGRKPMSPEARQRIADGLRKSAQAKAAAKAANGAIPASQDSISLRVQGWTDRSFCLKPRQERKVPEDDGGAYSDPTTMTRVEI